MEVRIRNRKEDTPLAAGLLANFGAQYGLASPELHDMNVVLDDALNNIIAYGYDAGAESEITIRLERCQREVVLLIEDRGRPFDPTLAPSPELDKSLQLREVGGLGIHFIRSLMDDVGYSSTDGINRLRMTKKIPPEEP